jgi:hypothetical protein
VCVCVCVCVYIYIHIHTYICVSYVNIHIYNCIYILYISCLSGNKFFVEKNFEKANSKYEEALSVFTYLLVKPGYDGVMKIKPQEKNK